MNAAANDGEIAVMLAAERGRTATVTELVRLGAEEVTDSD